MKNILGILCVAIILTFSLNAQVEKEKVEWYENLLAKDVKYEDFACETEYQKIVKDYYENRPISKWSPICHNDCPIVQCRPVIPYPKPAQILNIGGIVSVHILTNETGDTIYARVLSGHPLLRKQVRNAACQTKFKSYLKSKQQGVMHFNLNADSEDIEIPKLANVVRAY